MMELPILCDIAGLFWACLRLKPEKNVKMENRHWIFD